MRCTGGSAQKGSNELEPIIRIEQLTHTYSAGTPFQRSAVDGVELDIMPGEFLGVIGHTGSGKSTLIQHLNGLLKPTQGHIYLNGKASQEPREREHPPERRPERGTAGRSQPRQVPCRQSYYRLFQT